MTVRRSLALAAAVAGLASPALAQSGGSGPFNGFYVGGSAGGGWAHQSQTDNGLVLPGSGKTSTITITAPTDGSYDLSGGLLGGGIGYSFENQRYVFGVEGDGSWANVTGSGTCGVTAGIPHACGGSIRALGTIRGRLGYDMGPVIPSWGNVMIYATGGAAFADIRGWDALFGTSGDKSVTGWTVGGGVEAMLAANWSVKVEYLHIDFGNPAVFSAVPPFPEHVATTADVVRVGLNYNFNWAPPPVASPRPIIRK